MAKNQGKYTEEFKQEAVRLMESGGKPVAELARELGINDNSLYRWRKRYGNPAGSGLSSSRASVSELEAELKRVRQELAVVKQERDILKKAMHIISRSQP